MRNVSTFREETAAKSLFKGAVCQKDKMFMLCRCSPIGHLWYCNFKLREHFPKISFLFESVQILTRHNDKMEGGLLLKLFGRIRGGHV